MEMIKFMIRFVNDTSGSSAVEYVLTIAMVGVATITGMQALAAKLNAEFPILVNDM
jgi:Flp pilus assembly pilin Flp